MLKNYFIIGIRALLQRLHFSALNVVGLSIGMAACFVLIQFARYEGSYDSFHSKASDIYRVSLRLTSESGTVTEVPKNFSALGPALQRTFSEVKDFVRVFPIDGTIALRAGDILFNEKDVIFADAGMFRVFDFPVIHGSSTTALAKPNSIVLTRAAAMKYFNDVDCVGKQVTMREGKLDVALAVTAVIEDVPDNSHLPFDMIVSHATLKSLWGERADNSWDEALFYTYVLTDSKADRASLVRKLTPDLLTKFTGWNPAVRLEFIVQPLRDIYLTSHMVQEARVNGNVDQVAMVWIIAFVIVLLSWVNYVNLSTARYLERAKEVGVRKVIGASRLQLTIQFLAESIIMTLVGIIAAFVIVQTISPGITVLTGKSIPMWNNPGVLAVIFAMFMLGSIIAATFPALILSSLKITSIIKGAFKTSASGRRMRHGLIVLQFMISSVIIGGTFIVYQQLNFMRSADLGTDITTTIVLPSPNNTDSTYVSRASFFKTQLAKHGSISWVVSSTSIPGKQDNIVQGGLIRLEKSNEEGAMHYAFGVDRNFVPSYGISLVAGRNFAAIGDNTSVLINETAMRTLGFATAEEAVGRDIVANWTPKATIIGVVADYHQHSLKTAIDPVVLTLDETAAFGYFSIKVNASSQGIEKSLNTIKAEWERAFPANPFDYFFLDEYYAEQYQDDVRFGKVLGIFSALGLLIACLGISGLAVFNAAQRTKEISVRKVLGASMSNILVILSMEHIKLIVISLLIATPLTYYLSESWLSSFTFHVSISWWMLALPAVLIVIVSVVTIGSQSMKVVASNPTKYLS